MKGPKRDIFCKGMWGNVHTYTFCENREPKSAGEFNLSGVEGELKEKEGGWGGKRHNFNGQSDPGLIWVLRLRMWKREVGNFVIFVNSTSKGSDWHQHRWGASNKYHLNCKLCHLRKSFFSSPFLSRMPSVCMLQFIVRGHLVGTTVLWLILVNFHLICTLGGVISQVEGVLQSSRMGN